MKRGFRIVLPIGMVLLAVVVALSSWSISQLVQTIRYERQSLGFQSKIDDLYQLLQGAESSQRGYLLTGRADYLKTYLQAMPQIPREVESLHRYMDQSRAQIARFEHLTHLINQKLDDLRIAVVLTQNDQGPKALALVKTDQGERLMREIRLVLDDMDRVARRDLSIHESFVHRYVSSADRTIKGGAVLTAALVGLFAYLSENEIRRRMQIEKKLKSAQEAALVASDLKSQFLATVSHEIRTPLNGIIGMSEILKTRIREPENKRFIDIIHSSGEALLRIVNDILDFSKIEAGKVDFEYNRFSLRSTVEMASELFSVKARDKGLSLLAYVDPEIPPALLGDSSRVAQILRNLIGNAVKFTRVGGILIQARLKHLESDKAVVYFEVKDTGLGIPENRRHLLFEPFNQFNADINNQNEGTGLGLSICKKLAEQMDGRIGYSPGTEADAHGSGSTFWFEIPFRLDAPNETRSSASEAESSGAFSTALASSPEKWRGCKLISVAATPFIDEILDLYARDLQMEFVLIQSPKEQESVVREMLAEGGGRKFLILNLDDMASSLVRHFISLSQGMMNTAVILLARDHFEEFGPGSQASLVQGYLRTPFTQAQFLEALEGKPLAPAVTGLPNETFAAERSQTQDALILLVEDNSTNQILAEAHLAQLGFRCHMVANGQEALEALLQIQYDAVLMDCQMPIMDGYETTRRIRLKEANTGRRTPIIAVTANATQEDRERCLAVGMDDYVSKPFKSVELHHVLSKWVGGSMAAVVDWTILRELEGKTNLNVIKRLIQSFLKTLPHSLLRVEAALKTSNRAEIRHWAHQLKASSASLGATRLSTLCSELEEMAAGDVEFARIASKANELVSHGRLALEQFQNQQIYPQA